MSATHQQTEIVASSIPSSWVKKIDAICSDRSQTRSQWLYALIASAIGEANLNTAFSIEERLERLEAQVEYLSKLQAQVDMPIRTDRTPSQISSTMHSDSDADEDEPEDEPDEVLTSFLEEVEENSSPTPSISSRSAASPNAGMLDDDIEDEPDEILYDFLNPRLGSSS